MADPVIVNNPSGSADSSGGGMGFLVGAILLILFVFLLIYYGLPALRSSVGSQTPQINVPEQVDVNVNNPQQ